ncbi:MAG: FAD:protein FMN transferase [Clostridia bacterium]|nr:FAD:protein FMN transferase [Clostridia bacterium]
MDTVMSVTLYDAPEGMTAELQKKVMELEKLLSVTDPESEIYQLNRNGSADLSTVTSEVLAEALTRCAATDGALDITIYPAMQAWGFTTDAYRIPTDEELAALVEQIDYTQIDLTNSVASIPEDRMVDLGAVAKGYTAHVLTEMLQEAGVDSALLDLGGNIQAIGENPKGRPWGVAVQSPDGEGYLGILSVTDKAVVTSGGYERNFEQDGITYHHILDPKTAGPADSGLTSVTIVGDSGIDCDAFSTALYVMGSEKAIDFWRSRNDFECILLTEDGTLYVTEGLKDSFTSDHSMTIVERG